jgi:hypothetical protein
MFKRVAGWASLVLGSKGLPLVAAGDDCLPSNFCAIFAQGRQCFFRADAFRLYIPGLFLNVATFQFSCPGPYVTPGLCLTG